MPLPAIAPFLPLIGSGVNAVTQLLTNSSQKNTNLQMYNMERTNALADWNRQNEYNSPKAQMARYKEAGLNPHLIYGQSQTAQPVRSTDAKAPNYVAPRLDTDALNVPNIALQMGLLSTQTANLQAQADLKKQEYTFKDDYNDLLLEQGREKSKIMRGTLANTQLQNEVMQNNIKKIIADTQLTTLKKAQLKALTDNYITTNKILGYKVDTAKQEAEFVKKIQAIGVGGSVLASILRTIKYLIK